MKRLSIISLFTSLLFSACATVAPYERQFVSDPEMQMESEIGKGFNNYVHSIREGAAPAEGSKTSGGCGCN